MGCEKTGDARNVFLHIKVIFNIIKNGKIMKKQYFILFIAFILLLGCDHKFNSESKSRNLTSPLSRLWGHWRWLDEPGGEVYFSKLIKVSPGGFMAYDNLDEMGRVVSVNAGKDIMLKWLDKSLKNVPRETKDKIAGDLAGKASYLKYCVTSQEPNGIELEIQIGMPQKWSKCRIQIPKNGRSLKMILIEDKNEETKLYKFIDSREFPEDDK